MTIKLGWEHLLDGYPWFAGEGRFPLPAYSEFMPPPRLGRSPYGALDPLTFAAQDPFGWRVSEIQEEYELRPGLEHLAQHVVGALVKLRQGAPATIIAGHEGLNLKDNPYWPAELAQAGPLAHERHVVLLPLSLSRTQDDMGRVRWTLFGGSEQGPERAFWKSFYRAPGDALSEKESIALIARLLQAAYHEEIESAAQLKKAGFRILPTPKNPSYPSWNEYPLPAWTS